MKRLSVLLIAFLLPITSGIAADVPDRRESPPTLILPVWSATGQTVP